jgi:hypothetical protein
MNGDNLNNRKIKYLKDKINETESNSKNKDMTCIEEHINLREATNREITQ